MTTDPAKPSAHIYRREIRTGERTSLSVISSLIAAGSRVLDVGTGAGALGQHLQATKGCQMDGVTVNAAEAKELGSAYQQVVTADVEVCDLQALFENRTYDHVVCADLLEHLRSPSRVLESCRGLLKPGGSLILSVPHVGYSGLVAELFNGDFRYRKEGLLDATHLRFFTRSSLMKLLSEHGWTVRRVEAIALDLYDSEFKYPPDALPPEVARYLAGRPDAETYQFVVEALPSDQRPAPEPERVPGVAPGTMASFCAQLFVGQPGTYTHLQRLTCFGQIGQERQVLQFSIPAQWSGWTSLRLDPADRQGLFRLYALRLLDANGQPAWSWSPDADALQALQSCRRHDLEVAPQPGPMDCAEFMLLGIDPSIELPLPPAVPGGHASAEWVLEVTCGWPMSADFLATTQTMERWGREAAEARRLSEDSEKKAKLLEAALQTERAAHHALWRAQADQVGNLSSELGRLKRSPAALLRHLWNSLWARSARTASDVSLDIDREVAIIVPVYGNLELTRRCLESVVNAPGRTPWQLIVVNDASPQPEVGEWLREFARQHPGIQLHENPVNLGFVATVNLGMTLAGRRDVVLLNSDAEVANDWLDRLHSAAYRDAAVGTVTPFSNNATICSFPKFCEDNPLPVGESIASMDRWCATVLAGRDVDIPTAVGFCMYIRRDCLDAVGLFDLANFGHGYGEENDFCCRATALGWKHSHALDVFVHHAGGMSFGDTRLERQRSALAAIRRLHPHYEDMVREFVQRDPAAPFRAQLAAAMASGR